jgi:hypothetical protein
MEPVTSHMLQLEELEAIRSGRQQLPIPADLAGGRQQRQEAAEATKQCLLAIGDHITLNTKHMWKHTHNASNLFAFVASATQSRMSGEQLACLYNNIKSLRDRQRQQEGAASIMPAARCSAEAVRGKSSSLCPTNLSIAHAVAIQYNLR